MIYTQSSEYIPHRFIGKEKSCLDDYQEIISLYSDLSFQACKTIDFPLGKKSISKPHVEKCRISSHMTQHLGRLQLEKFTKKQYFYVKNILITFYYKIVKQV